MIRNKKRKAAYSSSLPFLFDWNYIAKRLAASSQFTTFHHAVQ
jgi:hypothetical protein